MGIINATPDSFYSKGHGSDPDALLQTVEKMLKDGASILDIGGASTKPGQELLAADEELMRVMPVIIAIKQRFPDVWLSIDTYNSRVAKEAVYAGVNIVNDVSSGRFDKEMLPTVASLKVPYIAMHMLGTPKTMQQEPQYMDVVAEVHDYFGDVCDQCAAAGITDIIIDPGFGFGKSVTHNFQLLGALNTLKDLGKPVLAGLSRKSMICKTLKVNPPQALNGTTALNMVALQQGANILRVHDVKEAMEVIKLYEMLMASN
jgi:dihydropteroate synthase